MNTLQSPSAYIVDSSVVVKWLNQIGEKYIPQALGLLEDLRLERVALYVPYLVRFEVGNALLLGKRLSLKEAADAFDAFDTLPLLYVDFNREDMVRTFAMAQKVGITFYDATFIALAQRFSAPLITDNPKHQGKIKTVRVISLKDYT